MKTCMNSLLFAIVLCASYPGECRSPSGQLVRPFGRTLLQQTSSVASLVALYSSGQTSTAILKQEAQLRSSAADKTVFDKNKVIAKTQVANKNPKAYSTGLVGSDELGGFYESDAGADLFAQLTDPSLVQIDQGVISGLDSAVSNGCGSIQGVLNAAQTTAQQNGAASTFNQNLAKSQASSCLTKTGGQSQSGGSGTQNGGGGGVSADDPQSAFDGGDGIDDDNFFGNFSPGPGRRLLAAPAGAAYVQAFSNGPDAIAEATASSLGGSASATV